jgi:D,D-heptose 1,7-bisphosphate phosphatase
LSEASTRWPDAPEQAVIFARRDAPAGAALLDYLVETCERFGFRRILLLARPGTVTAGLERMRGTRRRDCSIDVVDVPESLGTAAALKHAADRLEQRFLLLDGSVFDTNWLDLMLDTGEKGLAVMALRQGGLASGGVALIDRRILARWPDAAAIEQLFAVLDRGLVRGRAQDGLFLDPATPEAETRATLAALRRRAAVFFDRDGTINADAGYTHKPDDLAFLPGAIAAVKRVNDLGHYAFLVTNQSGVARGFFTEADVETFHAHLQRRLRAAGAHLDDIRYCADHPEATVPRYRRLSDWRKPGPGMLRDLIEHWPIRTGASIVVGDKYSDTEAAEAAGLRGLLYSGGRLDDLLAPHLAKRHTT